MHWRWPALFFWLIFTLWWDLGVFFVSNTPAHWSSSVLLEWAFWLGVPWYALVLALALIWAVRGFRRSTSPDADLRRR